MTFCDLGDSVNDKNKLGYAALPIGDVGTNQNPTNELNDKQKLG